MTVPRPILDTLPFEEQETCAARNPNDFEKKPQEWFNWGSVYAYGWVAHKFYIARALREALVADGVPQETITKLFKTILTDVPEYHPENFTNEPNSIPAQ